MIVALLWDSMLVYILCFLDALQKQTISYRESINYTSAVLVSGKDATLTTEKQPQSLLTKDMNLRTRRCKYSIFYWDCV